jgi:hypothetical protein
LSQTHTRTPSDDRGYGSGRGSQELG